MQLRRFEVPKSGNRQVQDLSLEQLKKCTPGPALGTARLTHGVWPCWDEVELPSCGSGELPSDVACRSRFLAKHWKATAEFEGKAVAVASFALAVFALLPKLLIGIFGESAAEDPFVATWNGWVLLAAVFLILVVTLRAFRKVRRLNEAVSYLEVVTEK
jgi:hypothetical protein